MTKQEEIREGVEALIPVNYITSSAHLSRRASADKILAYLHSQGLAIKVEREFPRLKSLEGEVSVQEKIACLQGMEILKEKIIEAGYAATEPLVGEKDAS